MSSGEAALMARLDALGIVTTTVRHPPMFTVAESKALRGSLPGGHSKNLFLKDKKGVLWLVVADEDRPIDLKALRRRIGSAALSFASAETLRQVLGVEPGSVTPFALINDREVSVRVLLDEGRWRNRPSTSIPWSTPRRRPLPPAICWCLFAPAATSRASGRCSRASGRELERGGVCRHV